MENENNEITEPEKEERTEGAENAEAAGANDKPKNGGKAKRRVKKAIIIVLSVILALIVALVAAYFILRAIGKSHFHPAVMKIDSVQSADNVVAYDEGKTINYDGRTYVYNEDVIYVAFMGVDSNELDAVEGLDHSAGQSDTNMLIAIDTSSGKLSLVIIPRDSMAEVNVMNSSGRLIGISNMQLCLAYAYGDGRETSCENVLTSMERLLYGIEIDNYYSLDLKGIGALNDAVGGIELTALETLPGGLCFEGQYVRLVGDGARRYVQFRDITTFNSDSLRRQRQIQYAKAFASKLFSVIKNDFSKISEIYGVASDYSCTNLDLSRVTYLASVIVDKYDSFSIKDEDIYVLPGNAEMGSSFMEVTLDKQAVLETILKVFYKEVTK